jgi:hypothetical protein
MPPAAGVDRCATGHHGWFTWGIVKILEQGTPPGGNGLLLSPAWIATHVG